MTMLPHSRWSGRSAMPSGPGWMSPSPGSVAACLVWFNADTKDNAVGENSSNSKSLRSISVPQMNISTGPNSRQSDRRQQTSRTQKTLDRDYITVQDDRSHKPTETIKMETQIAASDVPRTNRQDKGTTPRHIVLQSNANHKEASPRVSSNPLNSSRAAVNAAFSSSNKFTQTENTSSKTVPLQEEVATQTVHDSFNKPSMCSSRRPSSTHQTAAPWSPSRPPPSCFANERSVELKRNEHDNLTNLVSMRPNASLRQKSAFESGANQTMHSACYTSSSNPDRRQHGGQRPADKVRQSEQLFKRVVQLNTGQAMIPAKSNPNSSGFSLLRGSTSRVDLSRLFLLSEETTTTIQSQRTGGYGSRGIRPCSAGSSSHRRGDEHQRPNSLDQVNLQLTIRLK